MGSRVVIASHRSAFSFWMQSDERFGNLPGRARICPLESAAECSKGVLERIVDDPRFCPPLVLGRKSSHLHVLVPNENRPHGSPRATLHVCSQKLPASAFARIDKSLYVSSPWLCLAQMANGQSVAKTALDMMDLCGCYAVEAQGGKLVERVSPIATVAGVRQAVEGIPGLRGRAKVLRAAKHAVGNARSPRESLTVALLCLPLRLGGYGLPLPQLNLPIDPGSLAGMVGQRRYAGDLCWPEKRVIVEYNGLEWHQNHERDERRRNDLEALGWHVFTVYNSTLNSQVDFEKLALKVAHCLGHRVRRQSSWWRTNVGLRRDFGLR